MKKNSGRVKWICGIVSAILVVALLGGCDSAGSDEDWGSGVNWGPDHYWNSQTHQVEKNLHGLLH